MIFIAGSEAALGGQQPDAVSEVGDEVSPRQGRERQRWTARSTTERSGVLRGQPESPSSWTPILAQPQPKAHPLLHGFGRKLARDPQFRKVNKQICSLLSEK